MDDSIERRSWLDKLVTFMEEKRTPITSCPTISKNPLDLFRLYLYVKERGGFMEVCKVQCSSIQPSVSYRFLFVYVLVFFTSYFTHFSEVNRELLPFHWKFLSFFCFCFCFFVVYLLLIQFRETRIFTSLHLY